MFTTSARFARSIVRSHDVAIRCEIVDDTGTYVLSELDIVGGSVSADATRKTRQQCTITVQDPTGRLVPDEVDDLLQPYSGYYVRLSRGITWRDGTSELLPLGTFAPYSPRVVDTGDSLEISVTGYDRSKLISRTRWTKVYYIASGTNTVVAIKDLLTSRMVGLRYNFAPSGASVPLTALGMSAENDPWDDAAKIAGADGMELFFDTRDNVVLRDVPDPDVDPVVYTFDDSDNCTVLEFDRSNDASQLYTGVIVYSEGSEINLPIRVERWRTDTDLRIPYFFPTALIRSQEQAEATADTLLRRVSRSELSVDLRVVPDPRFEVGDVIRVKRGRSRLDDVFIISSINMPLDATSEMSIGTVQRRVESDDG